MHRQIVMVISSYAQSRPTMFGPTSILSFDVEEHYRIEAARGIACSPSQCRDYAQRMEQSTRKILDILSRSQCPATFFVLGEVAAGHPKLIREIDEAGHEVASHGWDHTSLLHLTRAQFRADLRKSKDVLEQTIGAPIYGYRAPTFSIVSQTAWALDELLEAGFQYDSSLFPIHHDRYGVPDAPTTPFRCFGPASAQSILEIPPLTLRFLGTNFPVGGGGYFRVLPIQFIKAGLWLNRQRQPSVSMFYFHPWEFDTQQPQLRLSRFSRWRTYAGISRAESRLRKIIQNAFKIGFCRARDAARALKSLSLPEYHLAPRLAAPPVRSQPAQASSRRAPN
jgi:polysaccharide deacetylase family protein (PEP-CTERM system associated)